MPERLHLLYPKCLAGRFETSNDLRANVEVNDPRSLIAGPRQIDINEVRDLVKVVLRIEAVCNMSSLASAHVAPGSPVPNSPVATMSPLSPTLGNAGAGLETTSTRRNHAHTNSDSQIVAHHRGVRLPPPAYLGPSIQDEMGDEELLVVVESLTTRLENAMSSIVSCMVEPMVLVWWIPKLMAVSQASWRVHDGSSGFGTSYEDRSEIDCSRTVTHGRVGGVDEVVVSACGDRDRIERVRGAGRRIEWGLGRNGRESKQAIRTYLLFGPYPPQIYVANSMSCII